MPHTFLSVAAHNRRIKYHTQLAFFKYPKFHEMPALVWHGGCMFVCLRVYMPVYWLIEAAYTCMCIYNKIYDRNRSLNNLCIYSYELFVCYIVYQRYVMIS